MFTLVDSNVILDLATEDATWFEWSSEALFRAADVSTLAINPIIYGEVSIRYRTVEDVEGLLPTEDFSRLELPYEAAFLAMLVSAAVAFGLTLMLRRKAASS